MAARGREEVRHNFLSTANLRNYLRLFNELAGHRVEVTAEATAAASASR